MSDGLTDGNFAMGVKKQKEKIQKLEEEFLEESSKEKVKEILVELRDYLSLKKGQDNWGQKRYGMYSGFIEERVTKDSLIRYLKGK